MNQAEIQDYKRISCGCCTGRAVLVQRDWGSFIDRQGRCTCWMHQDAPRGIPAAVCDVHARFPMPAQP